MVQFRKAERKKSRLRLGLAGPSGSGKTLSALFIAYGLTGDWEKIGLVDTENGSGDLYADTEKAGVKIGSYNVLTLTPPYTPERYMEAIRAAEAAGLEALIIDSLSHAWAGEGGLLDLHDRVTAASKSGNSFTAWREVTPKHNALVQAMLGSSLHLIATMRSKTEYVQAKDKDGSTVIKKVGLAPVQREGMEYEFTVFLDLSQDHVAAASKDRTGLLDGQYFKPAPDTGRALLAWLEGGAAPAREPAVKVESTGRGAREPGIKVESTGRVAPEPAAVPAGQAAGRVAVAVEGQPRQQAGQPAPGAQDRRPASRYGGGICSGCGKQVTGSGSAYSQRTFGRVLCPHCQQAAATAAAR